MNRLRVAEIEFMLSVLDLSQELRNKLEGLLKGGDRLGLEDADRLRDLCGNRLETHGFGAGYELTEEGQKLESLIDRLFVG